MKLLTRSTRAYLLIAILILLVAVPVFYFAVQRIVKEDVDESLFAQKQELQKRMASDSSKEKWFSRGYAEIISTENSNAPDRLYNESVYDSLSGENIPYRVLETRIAYKDHYILARFKRSLIDGKDLIQSIIIVVIVIMALMIAGMIIINRILSKRLWSPFYNTLKGLSQFELEKDHVMDLPATNITEFRDLQKELRELAAKSRSAYLSQKAFTENASHEMQTPLAVLQGKLEMLMQTEPLSPEQAELIGSMADASQRMNHLNKNLVLLTRIENKQYHATEKVSLRKEIKGCLDLYQDIAAARNITMENNVEQDMVIDANPTLIDILLSNLIGNAIRHNITGGRMGVELKGKQIIVWNTGIAMLDQQDLFRRFQQTSDEVDGLGLGLAISRKICEVSGFQIAYGFEDNKHLFTVSF